MNLTPTLRTAVTRAALLLLVLAVAGGCTSSAPGQTSEESGDYRNPPLPAKAVVLPPSAPVPPIPKGTCGNPTASLRPSDIHAQGPHLDTIRAHGRLVVGLDTGSNLFSFRDPISGNITGFDADIAREVARDLVGDPSRVEFRSLSSSEREQALAKRDVDIVVKTMTITCDRKQQVDFSTVYLLAHQRILTMTDSGIRDIADLAGKRVCVISGTTSIANLRRIQPQATILTVPTWADCLVTLQQRQVDAASTDDAILAGLAAQDPYAKLIGANISNEPLGIGIPKGDDDVVRLVNASLERIRQDGTWNKLYDKWLTVLGPSGGPPAPTYSD